MKLPHSELDISIEIDLHNDIVIAKKERGRIGKIVLSREVLHKNSSGDYYLSYSGATRSLRGKSRLGIRVLTWEDITEWLIESEMGVAEHINIRELTPPET